jgi:hypothetical protein
MEDQRAVKVTCRVASARWVSLKLIACSNDGVDGTLATYQYQKRKFIKKYQKEREN